MLGKNEFHAIELPGFTREFLHRGEIRDKKVGGWGGLILAGGDDPVDLQHKCAVVDEHWKRRADRQSETVGQRLRAEDGILCVENGPDILAPVAAFGGLGLRG